jgi:hypothetical protein
MYHTIVRHKIVGIFNELNKGNYEPVLRMTASRFDHQFAGSHALLGCRTNLDLTRAWYVRLFRIFPNLRFQLQNIVVSGWPWNTAVAVEWTDSYTLLNGETRSNAGVHFIRLKWGRGVSVRIYCDTEQLLQNLAIQQRGGIADAALAPLAG